MTQFCITMLAGVVSVAHLLGGWFAIRATGGSQDDAKRTTLRVAAAILAVFAVFATAAKVGLLSNFDVRPPWLPRFAVPLFLLTLLVGAVSPYGRRLALGLPIWVLVSLQGFRVPVELLLLALHREAVAPLEITYLGRNFDIVAGLTALPLAWLAARGKTLRNLLFVWNVLGILLLANIVGVALACMPGIEFIRTEPTTAFLGSWPYVLIPSVFVTTALLAHVVLFRRLMLDSRTAGHRSRSIDVETVR